MGRKATFDRDSALDKAMLTFWRDGYHKTSLEDLLDAMDIQISSFYNSFKSKESLFFESLKFYRANFGQQRLVLLTSEKLSGRESLMKYFDHLVYKASKAGYPPGCFMMKTAVNLAEPRSTVGNEVASAIATVEKGFANALERGVKAGEFSKKLHIEQSARILMAAAYGISVLSRTQKTKKELFDTAQALVNSFSER